MFAKAYELASSFTNPVIVSLRFYDKTVECIGGAFVVINEEGWIITVAHISESYMKFMQQKEVVKSYEQQLAAIQQDGSITVKQRARKLRQTRPDPKWITNCSFWWGWDGVSIQDVKVLSEGDILIGRLEPFDPAKVKTYPIFKDPEKGLRIGTSLCKLGYPFHKLDASFDENSQTFQLAPGVIPLPRFPLEGIYTRNLLAGTSKDGKYEIKFLETSTPGLRGQSGGPIFDTNGTVWAIQSRTHHFPLGFSPKAKRNDREIEEHQFLNVGLGTHPDVIVPFLRDNGISFKLSDY